MEDQEHQSYTPGLAYTVVSPDPDAVIYRPACLEDLDSVYRLEEASYPADEAATYEKLKMRIEQAPNVFMVAVRPDDGGIVGFTCGTQATSGALTHDSMSTHDPEGTLLCIHSVVVEQSKRRKGVATTMLRAYLRYVQATTPDLTEVRLLAKEGLVKLYQGVGFTLLGPSDVCHGSETWMEMRLQLPTPE